MALASRWSPELNDAVARYLAADGVEVVASTSRGQWAAEAFGMSFDRGLEVALEVAREAARMAAGAEAILVPGGAAMTLHVIGPLEEEAGKPVLTNLTCELWCGLVSTGIIEPVRGWGTLIASRP